MARVDIIMPLYNKASTVERAVRSILAQTMTDWRLIVVDDGSTDDGPQRVRAIDDPRIEIVTQANAGPGAARNAGLDRATAPYVAFLDADDEWLPDYLSRALNAIEEQDVALVASMYCLWPMRRPMAGVWRRRGVVPGVYHLSGHEDPAWVDWLLSFPLAWNSLVRTDIARRYGGFYAETRCLLGEDTTFFMKVGLNEPIQILPHCTVKHHTEDSRLAIPADRPLAPFFHDPQIILDWCPEPKKALARAVIDHMALRNAWYRARYGQKSEALGLVRRFPGMRRFGWRCRLVRLAVAFSPVLPWWVCLKRGLGRIRWALYRRFSGRTRD